MANLLSENFSIFEFFEFGKLTNDEKSEITDPIEQPSEKFDRTHFVDIPPGNVHRAWRLLHKNSLIVNHSIARQRKYALKF